MTSQALAPTAMRMPISRVRLLTACAMAPSSPMHASDAEAAERSRELGDQELGDQAVAAE